MFDYYDAFSRNIGWVTKEELDIIKSKKIAIGGLGGAGGEHAVTLTRMGFMNFNISDFDAFEYHNFNRQAGAMVSTVGKTKSSVIHSMIKDINPDSKVKEFPNGINKDNVDEFLEGVDVYVDGIDYFAREARELLYKKLTEKNIPFMIAVPLGTGVSFLCFNEKSMGYDDYFKFSQSKDDTDFFIKLLIGLAPSLLSKDYLVDPSATKFKEKKGPSTPMAIKLCSGVLVSNVLKIVLNRGDVIVAPQALQFDPYHNKLVISKLRWGNNGVIQKIKQIIARRKYS